MTDQQPDKQSSTTLQDIGGALSGIGVGVAALVLWFVLLNLINVNFVVLLVGGPVVIVLSLAFLVISVVWRSES